MGDFQDMFGAHVDVVDLLDDFAQGQSDDEDSDHLDEVIEHHIWFPDFVAAENWEKSHPGTIFRRRPFQGGYEVTVLDLRSESSKWACSGIHEPSEPTSSSRSVAVVRPFSLAERKVSHGVFTLNLSRNTSSLLIGFLDAMRERVPVGRAHLNPIIIPLKDFYQAFKHFPLSVAHELGLGKGVFAAFSPDHKLVIGRLVKKKEIQIWPWILEMDCGGGKSRRDGGPGCFLCDHYGVERKDIHELTTSDWYFDSDNVPHGRHHYIKNEHYFGDVKPKDLGRCVSDWLDLLSALDGYMDADRRPPSDIIVKRKNTVSPDLDKICDVIACAIAIRNKIEDKVTVRLEASSDLSSLKQVEHDTLKFTWGVSKPIRWNGYGIRLNKAFYDEIDNPHVPEVSGVRSTLAALEWGDLVDFHPKQRSPHNDKYAPRPDWALDAGDEVASGTFCTSGLTPEQRQEAEGLLQALLDDYTPELIKRCFESEAVTIFDGPF